MRRRDCAGFGAGFVRAGNRIAARRAHLCHVCSAFFVASEVCLTRHIETLLDDMVAMASPSPPDALAHVVGPALPTVPP
jgi:hypothetical protein